LIDTGKAKFYYMNYPFIHADSTTSALFAETVYSELGNDIFWKFHDSIFANQPDNETEETYTEEFLKERLKDAGATDEDITKVTEAFQKQTAKDSLQKDLDYVNQLNITGTPTIYVNGVKFEGSSYNELLDMVNEAAEK
ncbi:DsbA family protein, partial [Bacillales bacterium AN1005]